MIRFALIGGVGVVLGALIPIPTKRVSQQEEIQAVLASNDALWRAEKPMDLTEVQPSSDGVALLKSLVACQELHSPKVRKVERYEGKLSKWDPETAPMLQPNVVEAVLIEALSYCGDSAELIDLDCTERPCVAIMSMPSTIQCPWLGEGSPIEGLVELTAADLEWWPGKSDGFSRSAVEADSIHSVFIRSYDVASLWEKNSPDGPESWLRKNPESDSDWAQNVLRRALLREEMFIDAVGDGILGKEDSE